MRTGLSLHLFLAVILAVVLIGITYVPVSAEPPVLPAFIGEYLARTTENKGRQLLIAAGQRSGDVQISLYSLERTESDGRWRSVLPPMPATVGYRGFAPNGNKREGDGRSPSGRFPAGFAFGYAPSAGVATRLPYRQVTGDHFWNTDPASPYYNTWRAGRPGGSSYERMRRRDQQYKLGLVIRYNMDPVVPGHGSAIFLHIWRGPGKGTAGCIAVSETNMKQILGWLDPRFGPMIVMGTRAAIRAGRFP